MDQILIDSQTFCLQDEKQIVMIKYNYDSDICADIISHSLIFDLISQAVLKNMPLRVAQGFKQIISEGKNWHVVCFG